jgi:BirA family biotin operon repressor/biotin-[acetyl-CoA-carboxylase] ligase
MTSRVLILDFEKPDLLEAADPESIARSSAAWAADVKKYGPWTRVHIPQFGKIPDTAGHYAWQSNQAGDGPTVFVCGHCTSTMDAAWHFIENRQFNLWDSVIAVDQTAGRGQQKRHWISPAGNIHASWRWPLPEFSGTSETDWTALLPLIAGFVVARIFKEFNVPVQIKWPNDLLINNRKFGGILVEKRGARILAGIGLNTSFAPEDSRLREEFAVTATHLSDQGYEMTPLCLWATLVEKGKSLFEHLIQTLAPAEFVRLIDRQMAWVGKNVLIRQGNADVFEAVILGLAQDGGLRIKKGNAEEIVYSASIIPA